MDREDQFREAVGQNYQRICRICGHYFPDPDDRNDAGQEALIRIWENLPSFRGQSQLSTWIYRVTVNTCLSRIRSEKRRNGRITTGLDPEVQPAEQPAAEASTEVESKQAFLNAFLDRLGEADRILVSLYLEDLSTAEMAEVTGLSEANVRVRIHRIKEKIKTEWEETQHGTGRF